jgi:hypothetical protein
MTVTFVGLWGPPAAPAEPSHPLELRGVVERVPDTPDALGEWRIGGRAVMVGPQTRLEEHVANVGTEGYWTHAATGVVVRAPGWSSDAAHAAGFRPALPAEAGGITLGRRVKARVQPADGGVWQAIEIELQEKPRSLASR